MSKVKEGKRRGIFCRASWGTDYHNSFKRKTENAGKIFITSLVHDAMCKSMVDTGELVDRAVAERAGLGWSGKNCSIITPEFGSYVYLGEMITNIPFEPDTPMEDHCGECTKCLDACPTGALVQGGQINAEPLYCIFNPNKRQGSYLKSSVTKLEIGFMAVTHVKLPVLRTRGKIFIFTRKWRLIPNK